MLSVASPILLRLSTLSSNTEVTALLNDAVPWLERIEPAVDARANQLSSTGRADSLQPPHLRLPTSTRTDPSGNDEVSEHTWGQIVESLWRASMASDGLAGAKPWDALTSRMLVWNGLKRRSDAGRLADDPCEWARREVLKNLSQS